MATNRGPRGQRLLAAEEHVLDLCPWPGENKTPLVESRPAILRGKSEI